MIVCKEGKGQGHDCKGPYNPESHGEGSGAITQTTASLDLQSGLWELWPWKD